MELNEKQQKTITNLEKAFKQCAETGLKFVGIDTDLIVTAGKTTYEALIQGQEGKKVNTYNTYEESMGA